MVRKSACAGECRHGTAGVDATADQHRALRQPARRHPSPPRRPTMRELAVELKHNCACTAWPAPGPIWWSKAEAEVQRSRARAGCSNTCRRRDHRPRGALGEPPAALRALALRSQFQRAPTARLPDRLRRQTPTKTVRLKGLKPTPAPALRTPHGSAAKCEARGE